MIYVRPSNRGLGSFEGRPKIELLEAPAGQTRALLLSDFVYKACDGRRIICPAGLVYDGASIPSVLWHRLGPPLCWSNTFGLPHDAMYRLGVVTLKGKEIAITRDEADRYAWDMALCGGHSSETAAMIYAGLFVGGAQAWKSNAARRAACHGDRALLLASDQPVTS